MTAALTTTIWLTNVMLGLFCAAIVYTLIFPLFDRLYDKWVDAQNLRQKHRLDCLSAIGDTLGGKGNKAMPIMFTIIEQAGGRVEISEMDFDRHPQDAIAAMNDEKTGNIVLQTFRAKHHGVQ